MLLGEITSGHGLLSADYADYADIQETGLVGSLEKMGTHETQK
jgi:hypothetical protein